MFQNAHDVLKVNLSQNQLKSVDARLTSFERMRTLDISYNHISAFPAELCSFSNLTVRFSLTLVEGGERQDIRVGLMRVNY